MATRRKRRKSNPYPQSAFEAMAEKIVKLQEDVEEIGGDLEERREQGPQSVGDKQMFSICVQLDKLLNRCEQLCLDASKA